MLRVRFRGLTASSVSVPVPPEATFLDVAQYFAVRVPGAGCAGKGGGLEMVSSSHTGS